MSSIAAHPPLAKAHTRTCKPGRMSRETFPNCNNNLVKYYSYQASIASATQSEGWGSPKCNAVVQLYWALHGTKGSNPECKYSAGARLFRTPRGTKGYCLGALLKYKYSVVRSSRTQPGTVGYHLGTSPLMQCIAEGKKAIASSAGTLKYNKCKCSTDMKKATIFP